MHHSVHTLSLSVNALAISINSIDEQLAAFSIVLCTDGPWGANWYNVYSITAMFICCRLLVVAMVPW